MNTLKVRDVELSYRRQGQGAPVLLIPPAATRAALWNLHQVPALCAAGYEVITYDQRGATTPSTPPSPYRLADLVADAAQLITALQIGPCLVAGSSLGALVAQELALARPDLVRGMALLGTRGRVPLLLAELGRATVDELRDHRPPPPRRAAVTSAVQLFAPATLVKDSFTRDWLDTAEAFPVRGEWAAAQYEAAITGDRLEALAGVATPALVVAFAHDLIMPPALGQEVAEALQNSRYIEVADAGHFGFLERPDLVNQLLCDFFASAGVDHRSTFTVD